jgi:predicted RNA binding protein YcfA (HicA-like mRNA interferase family)
MSPCLPAVSGRRVVRALESGGFRVVRIKGSHHIIEHPDDSKRRAVIPVHGNEDLGRGLLRQIIDDVGLTVEQFLELL